MPYAMVPELVLADSSTRRLSHHAFRVLVYLAAELNGRPDGWKIGAGHMAKRIGVSQSTYFRATRELVQLGYIERTPTKDRMRGWSRYRLLRWPSQM